MSNTKIYEIPIMKVMYNYIQIEASSEEEAIEEFYEMDEAEMGYPFDDLTEQIKIDTSEPIESEVITTEN